MSDLVLKVSKADYQNTLNALQDNLAKLRQAETSLNEAKAELKTRFVGIVGDSLIRWVDKNLAETNNQIERVQNQIRKIEDFMNKMDTKGTTLEADVEAAAAQATALFKSK